MKFSPFFSTDLETQCQKENQQGDHKKIRNKEVKLLAEAIEKRTTQKKLDEEKRFEQRERLIKEMEKKNILLEKLLSTIAENKNN